MKWLAGIMLLSGSLLADMIAIAGDGNSLSSNISSNASRANYYIFVDKKGKTLEILENSFKDTKGGASFQLTQMLKTKGASHFVASRIGGKLENSLTSNNIKYTIHKGKINTFIQQLKEK